MEPLDTLPAQPDERVDDLLRRRPQAMRVFLERGLLCIGCPIGRHHTVADACAAHGIGLADLLFALNGPIVPGVQAGARPSATRSSR